MWRFVQLSDPHLGSTVDGRWNNSFLCTMMPAVIKCLKRDLAELAPEFILATGDIVSLQTRDAMFAARDLMDSLGLPYYPMGGNHDFVLEDSRAWFLEAFHAHLPERKTYYSFTHRGLHFCVLDPWWQWADNSLSEISETSVLEHLDKDLKGARWALPPHQFEWLEKDLSLHSGLPTVVASHYPAIPIPDRLCRPGMKNGGCLENGPLLIDLLRNHRQVKMVISGHVHMHFIEMLDGLTHVTTGALPEFPTEYRDVQVYDDHLEVHTRGLSDTSFAARSLIPGREWTSGHPCDRRAIVSLD